MLLYLLRHGIAMDRDDPSCPADPERPLTAKGVIRTRRATKGLANLGVSPSLILTSPYLRAAQTAEIAADELSVPNSAVRVSEALEPERSPREIMGVLAETLEDSVMLVGHAPNLDFVLARAIGLGEPVTSLRKAGCACLDFPAGVESRGHLVFVLEARALRRIRRDK